MYWCNRPLENRVGSVFIFFNFFPFLGRPEEWPYACMIVCLCVIILVYTFLHFGIHFFIGLYLFNTATDHVHFWHACTLGPGLYSPNVFGDAALINYANFCKICQSVNILVYTFLHFGIHFFISLYLFNTATDRVYFWHACTLGPGLYSPNVFGDAALINYANLCKICQSVNILVYTFFYRFISF